LIEKETALILEATSSPGFKLLHTSQISLMLHFFVMLQANLLQS